MAGVLVGMSGGVDSSVTAYLLKNQGHDVTGISFILCEPSPGPGHSPETCCSAESVEKARRTAQQVGINHTMLDLRGPFLERVVQPFIEGYRRGLTPNPCILCNRHIKFPFLSTVADERRLNLISTGHYARVRDGRLLKGLDPRKDQSYVLYGLSRDVLERLVLPLGTRTKTEVRAIAESLGLPAAESRESQEICFVGDRRCSMFLEKEAGTEEGPIIDIEIGKVIGRHRGVHLYTVGQRKRLVPTGTPRYVVKLDARVRTVYVGPKEMACARGFTVEDVNWIDAEHPSPEGGAYASLRATVKVRSTMRDEPALLTVLDRSVIHVSYDQPQWAPAPGQSAVFYRDEVVLGGGVITSIGTSSQPFEEKRERVLDKMSGNNKRS